MPCRCHIFGPVRWLDHASCCPTRKIDIVFCISKEFRNAQAKLQCNSAIEPSAAFFKHDWAWSFFCCNALQEYTVIVHVAIRYDCPCEDPCYCTGQMSFVSQAGSDSSCTSLKTLDVWMQFCVNFLCTSDSFPFDSCFCSSRRKDFHVELNAVLLWGPFCWFDHLLNWSNHSARHHRAHLDPLRMWTLTSVTKPRQPKQRKRRSCILKSQDLFYHFSSKGSSCNLDSKLRLTGHVEETQFQISTWQFLMYMMWFCLYQIFCCQDTGDSYPVVTMCAACVPPYDPNTATQKHQRLGSNDQINILWNFFSVKIQVLITSFCQGSDSSSPGPTSDLPEKWWCCAAPLLAHSHLGDETSMS